MRAFKRIKKDRAGLSGIILAIIVIVVLALVIVGGLFAMYSMNKYPGCVFAKNATEGNTGGVIQSDLLVRYHYNYMTGENTLTAAMPGKFDQITSSEMKNYQESFSDYVGGFFRTGAIETATTGTYSLAIVGSGITVYSSSGSLQFAEYGINPGSGSDTQATVSLPTIFLAHGTYVISINTALGTLSQLTVINWNC
jgi:hypothetical protein